MTGARRGRIRTWILLGLALASTGCGVALYGPPILYLLLKKNTTSSRTTFPDVAVTSVEMPAFAAPTIGTTSVKDAKGASGLPVTEVTFPGGFGISESDRLAGQTTAAADELLIQINGDTPQVVKPGVATVGTQVAAQITSAVAALVPQTQTVPALAYTQFRCTFDPAIQQYRMKSGLPGTTSAVVINPPKGTGSNAVAPSSQAVATAKTLKMGLANGGHERAGAENLSYVIYNHGTDVMPSGMPVNFWLSRTKTLDKTTALLVRSDKTTAAVEVARARRFTSKNQAPPATILQQSLPAGQYFLIVDANPGGAFGAEKSTTLTDNVATGTLPVEIATSVAPATSSSGPAPTVRPLDIVPTDLRCSIAGVAGRDVQLTLTVANFGAAMANPLPVRTDIVLAQDATFVAPKTLEDPAGVKAGIFVNPVDFSRRAALTLDPGGATGIPLAVSVAGDTVTATFDGAGNVTPIVSLTQAVAQNPAAAALLDLVNNGIGNPTVDRLADLMTAAGLNGRQTLNAGGRLVSRTTQTMQPAPFQQTFQIFPITVTLPSLFPAGQLPRKFVPFVSLLPVFPATGPDSNGVAGIENAANNVRTARNYLRIVSPLTATFDNGVFLPTAQSADFQPFAAVTGRPTNSGLVQGQQRIFRFSIPQTGIPLDESQLLMTVQTSQFDAHLELLDSTGHTIASSDDSALGLSPLIYTPALATGSNPNFYAVVSNATFTDQTSGGGQASFALIISVNPRQPADPSLVAAVSAEDLFAQTNVAVSNLPTAGLIENDKLMEFNLAQQKAEIMFVLPAFARVRFKSSPIFKLGVSSTITQFVVGTPVTQVPFQAEVDPAALDIVYRPSGGTIDTSHLLQPGIYTFSFNSLGGPDPSTYVLEIDADYVPSGP